MSLNELITSSITSGANTDISIANFFLCIVISIILGIFIAALYMYKAKYTKSFVLTLALLPVIVCMVIMMVNGNIGAGVAVAGTFSLVRFRSVPGTAKEIGAIFLAMGTGLAMGMGVIGYAIIFVLIVSVVNLCLTASKFGNNKETERMLIITMPEELDYTGVFDDLFKKYTHKSTLIRVKTTNMGSLFKVTYDIDLIKEEIEKEFLDDLRCRNGNLEIVISKQSNYASEL